MKKRTAIALLICLLLLAGCTQTPSAESSPPVSPSPPAVSDSPSPGTESTPPVESTPPLESTPPVESTPPAAPVSYPGASYRPPRERSEAYTEYFSVLCPYEDGMVTSNTLLEDRHIQYDAPTVYVVTGVTGDGPRQAIARIEDFHCLVVDEEWIYATEKGTTLFRMDWQGENRQDLLTDPELVGSIRMSLVTSVLRGEEEDFNVYLADGQVLFFLCGSKEASTLCRLFIPDRTLDVLLVALPNDPYLDWPQSNHEVAWLSDNPSFEARYAALKSDPTSDINQIDDFDGSDRGAVELIYHTSSTLYHYFNTMTGEYYSTLYDGFYYRHPNQPSWMPVVEY